MALDTHNTLGYIPYKKKSFSHSFEKTIAIKLVINTFLNALNPCAVYTYTRLKAATSNEQVGGYLHFFTDRILIKIYKNM